MKRFFALPFILLFALPGLPNWPQTAPPIIYEELAIQLVTAMENETADDSLDIFTEDMKTALSDVKLGDLWKQVKQQLGEYLKIQRFTHEDIDDYHVVIAVTEFSHMEFGLRLVFNEQIKIAGMQFVPAPHISFTPPPAYADTTCFREIHLKVGCGDIELPAKFCIPNEQHLVPLVVLVHGSGPNDMDETIGPNKPFRDIAWGLASCGIAVLRYEKRTKSHAESLDLETMTPWDESGKDAVCALKLAASLDGIDPSQLFLLGHSLGGMMAPEIARQSGLPAGIIIMGGNSSKLYDLIVRQYEYLSVLQDPDNQHGSLEKIADIREKTALIHSEELTEKTPSTETILNIPASYWIYIRDYNQTETARSLGIPILILQGERDYQVDMQEFEGWKSDLKNQLGVVMKSYPGLNHLFFYGEGTPDPVEYNKKANTDVEVIMDIAQWIKEVRKE